MTTLREAIVLRLGVVGKSLYELVVESGKFEVYSYDVDPPKSALGFSTNPLTSLAFPCSSLTHGLSWPLGP